MAFRSVFDVNHYGFVAALAPDASVGVFHPDHSEALAKCSMPATTGIVRRICWAPPTQNAMDTPPAHLIVVECAFGFVVLQFLSINTKELRIHHATALSSTPKTKWLSLPDSPAALAVTIDAPSMTLIWSVKYETASFSLVRAEPQRFGSFGQYCIHWKRRNSAKDTITLWPVNLSVDIQADAPDLVTVGPYSSLFAYTDALIGGLHIGTIHNSTLVSLPDQNPEKLVWVKGGLLVCLTGSTTKDSHRSLIAYDQDLTEVFSFSEVMLGSSVLIHRLVIEVHSARLRVMDYCEDASQLHLFDSTSDFIISGCGSWLAVKSMEAVSIWDVTEKKPELVRIFDFTELLESNNILWACFNIPCLFIIHKHTVLYLSLDKNEFQIIHMDIHEAEKISSVIVTGQGDLIICSPDWYHFVAASEL